jgi:hypothetical protein
MGPQTADTLTEKLAGHRIDHEEYNAMVRAHRVRSAGVFSEFGFEDELALVSASPPSAEKLRWFHCGCSEDVPPYSVFTLSAGSVTGASGWRPRLTVAKVSGDTDPASPLLTNGPYDGTAQGGCFAQFISDWDPVPLALFGDPAEIGKQTGARVDDYTVDEEGAGLVAVTSEDSENHQWFVRAPGSGEVREATLDDELLDNSSSVTATDAWTGDTIDDVGTYLLQAGFKVPGGAHVVIARAASAPTKWRIVNTRECAVPVDEEPERLGETVREMFARLRAARDARRRALATRQKR